MSKKPVIGEVTMKVTVNILARDVNGKHIGFCGDWHDAYKYAVQQFSAGNEDDILLITAGDITVYSQLTAPHPIDWEDLLGFLA